MSKLNIGQKLVVELLSDKKADFLIPDYQRSHLWEEVNRISEMAPLIDFEIFEEKQIVERNEKVLEQSYTSLNKLHLVAA